MYYNLLNRCSNCHSSIASCRFFRSSYFSARAESPNSRHTGIISSSRRQRNSISLRCFLLINLLQFLRGIPGSIQFGIIQNQPDCTVKNQKAKNDSSRQAKKLHLLLRHLYLLPFLAGWLRFLFGIIGHGLFPLPGNFQYCQYSQTGNARQDQADPKSRTAVIHGLRNRSGCRGRRGDRRRAGGWLRGRFSRRF